ncbi:MAG: rhodanese-like domain-containing protein [Opitutaceae bacterium]
MTVYQLLLLVVAAIVAFVMLRPLLFGGKRLSVAEAQARLAAGQAVLVDVREPGEWRAGVAKPAYLLPLSDLQGPRNRWAPFLAANKDKEILLYCASGIRSGQAAIILRREGFNVANIGSYHRWAGAGLATRQP